MKTYLDCIPCFFKQALESGRIAGASKRKQKIILDEVARQIPKISLNASPPQIARVINRILQKITKNNDIYAQIKKDSNRLALNIYDHLKRKVLHSSDRLLIAVELAIAGNIIDYGAKNSLNVDDELAKILNAETKAIKKENKTIFDYEKFKQVLKQSKTILYLADNAGETVFDRILIEEIKRIDETKEIIYAVKEKPVINDALMEDAFACGIEKNAQVISSGVDSPGTVLSLCSSKFLKIYRKTDMVISKGQGNFEALSQPKRPIFFLFIAKCPVIAKDVGCKLGDVILKYHDIKKLK